MKYLSVAYALRQDITQNPSTTPSRCKDWGEAFAGKGFNCAEATTQTLRVCAEEFGSVFAKWYE